MTQKALAECSAQAHNRPELVASDLPAPPPGRTGWPWTEASPQFAAHHPDQPRISVLMVSLNQRTFIEEAIRSVILQRYPNTEFIVIDGCSTDGTTDVLKRYSPWITHWVSERDSGTAEATNKALRRATGDFVGWLPSDDVMAPGALAGVAAAAREHPNAIVAGQYYIEAAGTSQRTLHRQHDIELRTLVKFWQWQFIWNSGACFVPMSAVRETGLFDERIAVVCDYDYFCRLLQKTPVHYIDTLIYTVRVRTDALTSGRNRHRMMLGFVQTARRYLHVLSPAERAEYRAVVANRMFAIALDRLKARDPEAVRFFTAALRISPRAAIGPFLRRRWALLFNGDRRRS